MDEEKLLWREKFKVRAYEAGHDGRVKFQAIFNYLQEAASNHAAALKLAKTDLDAMGLTWVLSRFHLQVFRYPFWNEQIFVETWPSKKEGLFALRDFEAFDEKERRVALATSSWMMIDFKERRPVRLPEFIADYENHARGRAIDDPFDRLPELQEVHAEKSFQVRLSDLDMNQHVNSTIYLDWALEAVPDEIRKKYRLQAMEANYRAESVYGQRVQSQVQINNKDAQQVVWHRLLRVDDQKEICRLISSWQAK